MPGINNKKWSYELVLSRGEAMEMQAYKFELSNELGETPLLLTVLIFFLVIA